MIVNYVKLNSLLGTVKSYSLDFIKKVIYTKNTSSDRGNLKTSKVCRLKTRPISLG